MTALQIEEYKKKLLLSGVGKTLTDDNKKEIGKSLRFISYKKGENIFKQGRPIDEIAVLLHGYAKILIENSTNTKKTIISIQRPVTGLGTATFYDETYTATAEAITDVVVAFLNKETMRNILTTNATFASTLFAESTQAILKYVKQLTSFSQKQIKARIAAVLLNLSQMVKKDVIDIQISRNDIADFAGVSTGSAIRILAELESEKIIELNNKAIQILNKDVLIHISEIDY